MRNLVGSLYRNIIATTSATTTTKTTTTTRHRIFLATLTTLLTASFTTSAFASTSASALTSFHNHTIAAMSQATLHQPKVVCLLGDSILDNANYVRYNGGPDVSTQLDAKLKRLDPESRCVLAAVDGAVISGVKRQLRAVPNDATHYVISMGGNDCLHELSTLSSSLTWLNIPMHLATALRGFLPRFREEYRAMLQRVYDHQKDSVQGRIIVCTIYQPNWDQPMMKFVSSIGLKLVNRIIIDEASKLNLPVIDLYQVFTNAEDYANPIEPGVPGGDKITNNIIDIISQYDTPDGASWASKPHTVFQSRNYSSNKGYEFQDAPNHTRTKEPQFDPTADWDTSQNEPFRIQQH